MGENEMWQKNIESATQSAVQGGRTAMIGGIRGAGYLYSKKSCRAMRWPKDHLKLHQGRGKLD